MPIFLIACVIAVGVFAGLSLHWKRQAAVAQHRIADSQDRIAFTLERFMRDHEREAERLHAERQMRAIRVVVNDEEDLTNSTAQEKNCA